MLPHFQIGLWETHVFIWFAIIYEAPNKAAAGKSFENSLDKFYKEIPKDYVWSGDHTKPDAVMHNELSKEELRSMFQRLQNVKKAEILCGYQISREDAVLMSPDQFIEKAESVFRNLLPLYKMA